eukprot:m.37621 g.37621  ORF g.37621 m.37621 type:complete len:53 (-) comp6747_c0_seq4:48-206(-)
MRLMDPYQRASSSKRILELQLVILLVYCNVPILCECILSFVNKKKERKKSPR